MQSTTTTTTTTTAAWKDLLYFHGQDAHLELKNYPLLPPEEAALIISGNWTAVRELIEKRSKESSYDVAQILSLLVRSASGAGRMGGVPLSATDHGDVNSRDLHVDADHAGRTACILQCIEDLYARGLETLSHGQCLFETLLLKNSGDAYSACLLKMYTHLIKPVKPMTIGLVFNPKLALELFQIEGSEKDFPNVADHIPNAQLYKWLTTNNKIWVQDALEAKPYTVPFSDFTQKHLPQVYELLFDRNGTPKKMLLGVDAKLRNTSRRSGIVWFEQDGIECGLQLSSGNYHGKIYPPEDFGFHRGNISAVDVADFPVQPHGGFLSMDWDFGTAHNFDLRLNMLARDIIGRSPTEDLGSEHQTFKTDLYVRNELVRVAKFMRILWDQLFQQNLWKPDESCKFVLNLAQLLHAQANPTDEEAEPAESA